MAVRSQPTVLSLCAGIGGLDIALNLAVNARTCCYVEWEAYAAAVIVAGMEAKALDQAPVWSDVTTFNGTAWRGRVDIIAAGFPCQPFSTAGQNKGRKDERWIWPDIARIIREVRPTLVFLENVSALLASVGGFGQVLGDLAEAGFNAEWCVLGADDVGATHRRKRVFVLAYRQSGNRSLQLPPSQQDQGRMEPGGGSEGLLLFPPHRTDYQTWENILAQKPETEPAIRGVADGSASRADQLHALGNSVVPLQAAYVFCTLLAAIKEG